MSSIARLRHTGNHPVWRADQLKLTEVSTELVEKHSGNLRIFLDHRWLHSTSQQVTPT